MKPVLMDASCIVACLDVDEPRHRECLDLASTLPGPLITCEAVIAEACHLLRKVRGAKEAILQNVKRGVFQIPFALADRASEVETLMKKYADVPMDLADACLVDLATQTGTGRILTLDGDFKIYRWGRNRPFEILLDV